MDTSPPRVISLSEWRKRERKGLTDALPPLSVRVRNVQDICTHAREWPGFIEHEEEILLYIQQTAPAVASIYELWWAYKAVVLR